jgi:antitoxin MazE
MAGTARVQIVKWGNSQAVRLPKRVLEEANLGEGDEVVVSARNGRIELEPVAEEITLEKLLKGITPRNLHREQDWGRPAGREIW